MIFTALAALSFNVYNSITTLPIRAKPLTHVITSQPGSALDALTLRVLHTTDLHGQLLAFDYHRDAPVTDRGLDRAAALIRQHRETAGAAALFDSGDFLYGSPLTNSTLLPADMPHPVISSMNALGYSAATLGNHDLDFGLPALASALEAATFPIVSANLTLPAPYDRLIKPYTLLEVPLEAGAAPVTLGVTGCLPADTLTGSLHELDGVHCAPVQPALTRAVDEMRAAGADVVIVLAHCGYDGPSGTETIQNAIAPIDGIDLILGGHTHEVLRRQCPDQPVVLLSGTEATHLGFADLPLNRLNGAAWRLAPVQNAGHCVTAHATRSLTPDPALADVHKLIREALKAPLGETLRPITSHFALVQDNAALQLVAEALEHASKPYLKDTATEPPLLSIASLKRTGQYGGTTCYVNLPAGPLTHSAVESLYSFPDTLCLLDVTGHELKMILEASAAMFQTIPRGAQDHPLFDPAFPGHRFSVIPQLRYEVDLSVPALLDAKSGTVRTGEGRVKALSYDGKPVGAEDRFTLAASSFHALVRRPLLNAPLKLRLDTGKLCRALIAEHIRKASPISGTARRSWSFAPIEGASATFETAPDAAPGPGFTRLGLTKSGFERMRLDLSA